MKKDLVSGLIKVANNLDSLGYMEEANIVDRVAKKIIVSQYQLLNKGQAQYIKITNNYNSDISNYKNLVFSAYDENNTKNKKLYLKLADDLLRAVKERGTYDDKTKKAFELQTSRILYDAQKGYEDINIAFDDDKSKPLNYYLMKYNITDFRGNLKDDIISKEILNTRFKNLKNDPDIVGKAGYFKRQLGNTYNLLALRF